ncbi:MAG: hypothetical protein EBZ78_08385 [Verrucomicrobia bacterium]|nr:hypothetical protein [Verrucomicrobiota bacterium]
MNPFWEKQVFFVLGAGIVWILFSGVVVAQIPEREAGVVPERDFQEEEMAQPAQSLKQEPLKLTGYVDGTYLYNFGPGSATNPLDFPTDTVPRGDMNLSALWLRLEKPLARGNNLDAGFQCGVMIGEDATYYAAAGAANEPSGPNSSSLYLGEAFAKFWVPDAQMEIWAGKFQSVIGYETVWRPDNPCITFGIADAFMPQDNIGVLAIFTPDPLFDIAVGVGNCSGESNDLGSNQNGDEFSVFNYMKIRNEGGNAMLQPGFYVTPSGTHASNARVNLDQNFYYAWNVIGEWSPLFAGEKWKLAFDVTGGSGTGDIGHTEAPTTYATGGLYSTWYILDPVSLTGRAEYVHTSNNAITQSTRLSGGDYYDYTLTLGVKITEELVWRGEGRFAWGAELMTPTSSSLWTAATEIYYRF